MSGFLVHVVVERERERDGTFALGPDPTRVDTYTLCIIRHTPRQRPCRMIGMQEAADARSAARIGLNAPQQTARARCRTHTDHSAAVLARRVRALHAAVVETKLVVRRLSI